MKKKYKITPYEYHQKIDDMGKITYKTGYDGTREPNEFQAKYKDKYDKLKAETESIEVPEDGFYFYNEVVYNLWLNRDTDEPITAKELYTIIETMRNDFDSRIRTATYNY